MGGDRDERESGQLRAELDDVLAARDQMQGLVQAIVSIGAHLDLDITVHRIVDAAKQLSGAPYAALGMCSLDGTFESFVCSGIDDDTARLLGDLHLGAGMRWDDMATHPPFDESRIPPFKALLGIPIAVSYTHLRAHET